MTINKHHERPPLIKSAALFAAFVFLPIFFFTALSWHAVATSEERKQQALFQDLEQRFFGLLHQTSPAIFCASHLRSLLNLSETCVNSEERLLRLLSGVRQRWVFQFDPYFFSSSGNIITPASFPVLHRFAMRNLWRHLSSSNSKLTRNEHKLFETLFGSDFSISEWRKTAGDLQEIRYQGKDGYLVWKTWKGGKNGGAIFVVRNLPSSQELYSALSPRLTRNRLFLFAPGKRENPWFGAPLAKEKRFQIGKSEPQGLLDNMVWRQWEIDGIPMILGRQITYWPFPIFRKLVILLALALLAISTYYFRRFSLNPQRESLPIRFKLIFLFLFSLSIPAAGTAFLGFRLLADRRKVLEGKNILAVKEELNDLDSGFLGEQNRFQDLCRSVRDRIGENKALQSTENLLRELKENKRIRLFQLRDLMGNLLFKRGDHVETAINYLFEAFAKCGITRTLRDRLSSPEGKGFKPLENKVSQLMQSPELGFASLLSGRGLLHQVTLSRNLFFWFWDSFPQSGNPAAFLIIMQSFGEMEKSYLESRLTLSFLPEAAQTFRFAVSKDGEACFPQTFRAGTFIRSQLEIVTRLGRPIDSRLRYKGRNFLLVGQAGKHLTDFSLFALVPEDNINQAVSSLRFGIFLCLGAGTAVAIFIGVILANHFLVPIQDLRRGMIALQRRNVDFRVPLTFSDEFGDLARTFNLMIEDLREMELAKIVQSSFIPKEVPEIPGYRISLENLVATDLGGDYCDVLPLPGGDFLIVMGDVTGHGIGAALGMTVAKAITFQFAREGGELATLFFRLNQIMLKAFQRVKLLTLVAAHLNPKTGNVKLINAGHPFPCLSRKNRGIEEISHPNFPLGSRTRKVNFRAIEFEIPPGETLFFYTDGIVEGRNQHDELFGYDKIHEIVSRECQENPDGLSQKLLAEFSAFCGKKELEDDITLLTLHREVSES